VTRKLRKQVGGPVLRESMKLMAWNCQGLGNASAVQGLLKCQKSEEADILFMSKTKLDERCLEKFKVMLGLGNMEVVDCEGKGGGIAVFWWGGTGDRCGSSKQIKESH
jgi:hypothetical protein